jgi:HAMP domain-containing protein
LWQAGRLEAALAFVSLGFPFSLLWQSQRAGLLRRRLLPYYYYEGGAIAALEKALPSLGKLFVARFMGLALFAALLPWAFTSMGFSVTIYGLAWYILCILALALDMALVLKNRLVPPLTDLDLAMRRFASGEYDALVDISSGDEIGQLQASWNQALPVASARQARLENFGGLFPEAQASRLLGGAVRLDPHPVEVCLLRASFRAQDSPDTGLGLSNRFLEAVAEAADRAGAAMQIRNSQEAWILFNVPLPQDEAAAKSLACAWALWDALKVWASIQRIQNGTLCTAQLALHSGSAAAGRLGPRGRGIYGLAGAAPRYMESLPRPDALLASSAFVESLDEKTRGLYEFKSLQDQPLVCRVDSGPALEAAPAAESSALPFAPGERL